MIPWEYVEYSKYFLNEGRVSEAPEELIFTTALKGQAAAIQKTANITGRRNPVAERRGALSAAFFKLDAKHYILAHIQSRYGNDLDTGSQFDKQYYHARYSQFTASGLHTLYQNGYAPLVDVIYKSILNRGVVSKNSFHLERYVQGVKESFDYFPPNMPYYADKLGARDSTNRLVSDQLASPTTSLLHAYLYPTVSSNNDVVTVTEQSADQISVHKETSLPIHWVDQIVDRLVSLNVNKKPQQLQVKHPDLSFGTRLQLAQAVQRILLPIFGEPITFGLDRLLRNNPPVMLQFLRPKERARAGSADVGVIELKPHHDGPSPQTPSFTVWFSQWRDIKQADWESINHRLYSVEPFLQKRDYQSAYHFASEKYPAQASPAELAAYKIELRCQVDVHHASKVIQDEMPKVVDLSVRKQLLASYGTQILRALAQQSLTAVQFEKWIKDFKSVTEEDVLAPALLPILQEAFNNCQDILEIVCSQDTLWVGFGSRFVSLLADPPDQPKRFIQAGFHDTTKQAVTELLFQLLSHEVELTPVCWRELKDGIIERQNVNAYYNKLCEVIDSADDTQLKRWFSVRSPTSDGAGSALTSSQEVRLLIELYIRQRMRDAAQIVLEPLNANDVLTLYQLQQQGRSALVRQMSETHFDLLVDSNELPTELIPTILAKTQSNDDANYLGELLKTITVSKRWVGYRHAVSESNITLDPAKIQGWLKQKKDIDMIFDSLMLLPKSEVTVWDMLQSAPNLSDHHQAKQYYRQLCEEMDQQGVDNEQFYELLRRRRAPYRSLYEILERDKNLNLFFLAAWEWLENVDFTENEPSQYQTDFENLLKHVLFGNLTKVVKINRHQQNQYNLVAKNHRATTESLRKVAVESLLKHEDVISSELWISFFTNGYGIDMDKRDYLGLLNSLPWPANRMIEAINSQGVLPAMQSHYDGPSAIALYNFLERLVDSADSDRMFTSAVLYRLCNAIEALGTVVSKQEQARHYQFWIECFASALNNSSTRYLEISVAAGENDQLFRQLYEHVTDPSRKEAFKMASNEDFSRYQQLPQPASSGWIESLWSKLRRRGRN